MQRKAFAMLCSVANSRSTLNSGFLAVDAWFSFTFVIFLLSNVNPSLTIEFNTERYTNSLSFHSEKEFFFPSHFFFRSNLTLNNKNYFIAIARELLGKCQNIEARLSSFFRARENREIFHLKFLLPVRTVDGSSNSARVIVTAYGRSKSSIQLWQ